MINLPMTTRLFASTLLVVGLSQTAVAESNTQQNRPSTSENMQAPPEASSWTLRQRLASAGFHDVNIVPSSLVITAIDRAGRPVLMRITPSSMFFLIPAISPSATVAARTDSNDGAAQQTQLSTTTENTQASIQDVPQSVTTGAAAADSNDNAQQNQPSISAEDTQASARDVPQPIRERLTSAGFTDVNMVPGSSVITARDRSDRPVMMRMTPRSIFFVTEIPAASASTTGAASSSDSSQDK